MFPETSLFCKQAHKPALILLILKDLVLQLPCLLCFISLTHITHHSALYPPPVESATPALTFSFQLFSFPTPSARLFIHCSIKLQVVQGEGCVVTYHGAILSSSGTHRAQAEELFRCVEILFPLPNLCAFESICSVCFAKRHSRLLQPLAQFQAARTKARAPW